jgi:copper chaperone CopZ
MVKYIFTLLFTSLITFNVYTPKVVTYDIPRMICGNCAKTITTFLVKRKGLRKDQIKFNITTKQVTITSEDGVGLTEDDLKYIDLESGYNLVANS